MRKLLALVAAGALLFAACGSGEESLVSPAGADGNITSGINVSGQGKVTGKQQSEGRNEVHLDVWVENNAGTVVTPGNAVVLLPTRDAPVELPRPAEEDIDRMFAHEVAKLA